MNERNTSFSNKEDCIETLELNIIKTYKLQRDDSDTRICDYKYYDEVLVALMNYNNNKKPL